MSINCEKTLRKREKERKKKRSDRDYDRDNETTKVIKKERKRHNFNGPEFVFDKIWEVLKKTSGS